MKQGSTLIVVEDLVNIVDRFYRPLRGLAFVAIAEDVLDVTVLGSHLDSQMAWSAKVPTHSGSRHLN